MTQIPDENTLISYFHRDDDLAYKAFTQIVDNYSKRLYATIRRWVNNHELTNDIIQEVFIKVWNNRKQFQGNSALFSWIYRIAYNETIHFLKKENKHKSLNIDEPLVSISHHSEHYGKLSAEEISKLLFEALEILPEKQRMVFEYKYFEDLKYDEIAQLTGGSVGGLKANYFHAVGKIEEYLKGKLNH